MLVRIKRFTLRGSAWVRITQPVGTVRLNPRRAVVAFKMKWKKGEFKQRGGRRGEAASKGWESKCAPV